MIYRSNNAKHRNISLLLGLILLSAIAGCKGSGGDKNSSDNNGGTGIAGARSTFALGDTSDSSGNADVSFSVPAGTSKFSITVTSDTAIVITSVSNQNGSDYITPGGVDVSSAREIVPNVHSVNVPSRIADGTLDSSITYNISVKVGDSADGVTLVPRGGIPVTFTVDTTNDTDFSGGVLQVNIFRVGTAAQDPSLEGVIQAAISEMKRIYGNAGLQVNSNIIDVSGPAVLPDPGSGGSFYLSASSLAQSPGVNIFIGSDIENFHGTALGIAANIPGSPIPTVRSAVAVSLIAGAGRDGSYSDEETRLLGETFAHEAGHYIGLFHPVDISGLTVIFTDPLSDTPTCSFRASCESNGSLNSNLMFPNPVIGNDGALIHQDNLTDEQRGVMQRYSAVS